MNTEFIFISNIKIKLSTIEIFSTDISSIDNIISSISSPTPFNNAVYTITIKILYIEKTKNNVAIAI